MFENKRCKNEKTFSVYKVFFDKFLQNSVKRRNLPVNGFNPSALLKRGISPKEELIYDVVAYLSINDVISPPSGGLGGKIQWNSVTLLCHSV
jgi:hypothetical protein